MIQVHPSNQEGFFRKKWLRNHLRNIKGNRARQTDKYDGNIEVEV